VALAFFFERHFAGTFCGAVAAKIQTRIQMALVMKTRCTLESLFKTTPSQILKLILDFVLGVSPTSLPHE